VKVFSRQALLCLCITGIVVFLFLLRVLLFAGSYGGVEHDSGWYLGVAKNVALRGIYASYTNTIGEDGVGAHPSIHGRFSVQDRNGYIYFPAGVTVGPGYVLPEAFLLKVFGSGWWQYRLWPLIAFLALLVISFTLVWRIGGGAAFFIFALWLWAVPQFTTAFAFESFSEDIAFLYLLVGFVCAQYVYLHQKKIWGMTLSGMFLSLAYLTKDLFILPVVGIAGFFAWDLFTLHRKKMYLLKKWALFAVGFIVLPLAFFVYEQWFLVSHFGVGGLHAVQEDFRLHFASNGSGIENLNLSKLDWSFIYKKAIIWLDVGISQPLLLWGMLVLFPIVIVTHIKKTHKALITSLYLAMVVSFIWFILLSPAGWARHAWQAVMLGMMFVSIGAGSIYRHLSQWKERAIYFFILIVILFSVAEFNSMTLSPVLDASTISQWRSVSMIRGINGFPSNDILSFSDQDGLVKYFRQNIKKNDRIYYVGWFLNAEMSPLVDKVFYTLDRYMNIGQINPDGGKSYAIFGPYQQGTWSMEPPDYVVQRANQLCDVIVFQNPSYLLCTLQTNIHYVNAAY